VVRWAWLSMFGFLFLLHSFRHPIEFAARAFEVVLGLLALTGVHLDHRFVEPLTGTAQDGQRHFQITFHLLYCGRRDWRRLLLLALRFEEQLRLGENALTNRARAVAPGRIELLRGA
jgi:hypothetical protein